MKPILFAAAVGLLAAAAHAEPPATVSFRRDIAPLFAKNCAFCHMKEGPDAALILEPRLAHAMIVDIPSTQSSLKRVAPGDPERSYLLLKMQNRHREVGGTGSMMPITPGGNGWFLLGGYLTATPAEIDLVRAWISAGALDN